MATYDGCNFANELISHMATYGFFDLIMVDWQYTVYLGIHTVIRVSPCEGTICDHMWPYKPYATVCDLTGGRVGTGEGTMRPYVTCGPVARNSVFFAT